ncbi:MAG: molybdopterin cofactor-binding domain-containing protein [Anaerolineae bacterium]|nr:molybdopterin-dependent oxidoreductase [Thermoflexales bacterium]MDW8054934.1 molybdopterin cofactor-binding domain-containing protein [Anaerolineae bacterium]
MAKLTLTINGEVRSAEVPPGAFLADVLRETFGLTGTKIGCNEAECGICTVLVDGVPVNSCIYPALKANGAHVQTVEGLAQNGKLHPLQQAFIDHGAVQCGFCTPGLLMTAKALLDQNPNPTEDDIKHALKDTYCRCTGYVSVINAIRDAAARLRGEPPIPPSLPHTKEPLRFVGRPLPRPDAVAKVTGAAKYTDDYVFPNMLHGATLRAGIPHARIKRIDTSKAKALPGVVAVLTHEDVPGRKNHGLVYEDWPVLCYDKVRYVGDAVAIVAAETREIAEQALKLIEVEYEPLPVVDDPIAALAPDAPKVHEQGNLLKHIHVEKGDIDQGFAEADVIVEGEYQTATTEHAFLEPECSIGRVTEDGRIEVYVGSQIPYADRRQVANALGVPEDRVRIIGTLIGGGFGGKEDIAGQIHAALLAKATGRPVKILYRRSESLIFHPKRHAVKFKVKVGAKRDGTFTAMRIELWGDTGAYASLGDKVMTRAATHASGPYEVPHVKIDCYAVYTNNVPAGAFRGFGVTQSAFAIESAIDELAHRLGISPIEIRRKNALRVGSVTNTGAVIRESVGLLECIARVEQALQAEGTPWVFRKPDKPNKVYAWGFAAAYKNTGLGGGAPDRSEVEVEAFEDGSAEVRTSAAEIGQGLVGVLASIAAEELGVPYERVRVLLSDTDLTPDGGPTTASRQTYVTGNAARLASIKLRERLASVAAEMLDVPVDHLRFEDGYVRCNGKAVSFAEVVRQAHAEGIHTRLSHLYEAPKTQPLGTGGDMHFAFSYAAQAALVEVDLETGEVNCLKVISATDVGRAINPLALQGQIEGGIVMCLGNALTEEFIQEKGIPYTNRFARYKMPSIRHTPQIVSFIVEDPAAEGPYGAKGVGEISSIPTTPAITNAIFAATGVRVRKLPVDQDALLRAMRAQKAELAGSG